MEQISKNYLLENSKLVKKVFTETQLTPEEIQVKEFLETFTKDEKELISDLYQYPEAWENFKEELLWIGVKTKIILEFKKNISFLWDSWMTNFDQVEFVDSLTNILLKENNKYYKFLEEI